MCSLLMLTCCLSLALAAGCTNKRETTDQSIEVITQIERFDDLFSDARTVTLIIDVRIAADYQSGHIPGAIHLPLASVNMADPRISASQEVVFYGKGWQDALAPAAAKKLHSQGYDLPIYVLRGGIELWQVEGRTLTTPKQ